MQNKRETLQLVFRIFLMLIVISASGLVFMQYYYFTGILFLCLLAVLIVETCFFVDRYFSRIDKILSAMLHEDYSADFQIDTRNQAVQNSIRLYNQLREKESRSRSQKLLYDQILNGLDSGLIILKLSPQPTQILFMNQYFQHYFGLPTLKDWSLMTNYLGEFYALLEERKFGEFKTALDIRVDKGERQTFILQTSRTQIKGDTYYTILVDSIHRVIYSKENEAWVNVMKVISHELMNSLAPIHALAQNMNEILHQDQWDQEDLQDMQLSIKTIINRSNHLRDFVDRYRKLTMLPTPVLQQVKLNDLIHNMMANYQYLLDEQRIQFTTLLDEQLYPQLDQAQFEQVLINLFTNSIHALSTSKVKEIHIHTYRDNTRIFLEFMDSGPLIDTEIVSKIFLPFYTTRKDGAGIGLSLSKSIIEAHQGYLYYQVKSERNCFVVVLMDR